MYIGIIDHEDDLKTIINIGSFPTEGDRGFILNTVIDQIEKTLSAKFKKKIRVKIHQLPPHDKSYDPILGGMYCSAEIGIENLTISGDIIFSETKLPKTGTKQVANQWSKVQEPNLQILYNHITLDTPLGLFVIDWKGWKEQPTYDLSLNYEWLDSPFSLEEGKEFVKKYLTEKAEALNDFIEGLEG